MELKDVILSTLAEMEDDISLQPQNSNLEESPLKEQEHLQGSTQAKIEAFYEEEESQSKSSSEGELIFLNSIRERLLVLFEGFQAPNNTNIEAKVDMTLNFLEYTLATIDTRVQIIEKGSRK